MTYEDLDLRFTADGAGFAVSLHRGAQVATEAFAFESSPAWDLWTPKDRGPDHARTIGGRLFATALPGRIRDLYQQARGGAAGVPTRGVRLRIHLDPTDRRLHHLLRLPWEALFDRVDGAGRYLALDPRTVVVRTIDTSAETRASTAGDLKRVLVAGANPFGSEPLDLIGEERRIQAALGRRGISPRILRPATRLTLFNAIRDHDLQVVHFMGHGEFSESGQEGTILLETDDGGADPLPGHTLAGLFAAKAAPRLIVLAACDSAEPGRGLHVGAFASMAAALVAGGLPAVLAMQAAVPDDSAIRFTERLYGGLVDGDRIEAAVTDARLALHTAHPDMLDWAIPVLFVRGTDEQTAPPAPERAAEPAQTAAPHRIENNVFIGSAEIGIQHNTFDAEGAARPRGRSKRGDR